MSEAGEDDYLVEVVDYDDFEDGGGDKGDEVFIVKKKNIKSREQDKDQENEQVPYKDPVVVKLQLPSSAKDDSNSTEVSEPVNNFEKVFLKYTPDLLDVPTPYQDDSNFMSHPLNIDKKGVEVKDSGIGKSGIHDIIDSDEPWPSSTSAHCHWCCHAFDGIPFGMPIRLVKDKFFLQGNFCSLECATAFNFSNSDVSNKWKIYDLINLFAIRCKYMNNIKCAPNHRVLKMFGGTVSIDEFRMSCKTAGIITMFPYPVIATTPQIMVLSNTTSNVKFVPTVNFKRANQMEQKMYEADILKDSSICHKMKIEKEESGGGGEIEIDIDLEIEPATAEPATENDANANANANANAGNANVTNANAGKVSGFNDLKTVNYY